MPSRRQIRESVVQYLYCSDLEGGANPTDLRIPFWDLLMESDRRALLLATFRTVFHLSHGRDGRLTEFFERQQVARTLLAAWPEAEPLKSSLSRIALLETRWGNALSQLERLPKDDDDASVADNFESALRSLFETDRALAEARTTFLNQLEDFPNLRGPMEAVAATIRRLQRISDRIRMVEEPEKFPEQTDLSKIRESKAHILELRRQSNEIVDQILSQKQAIDDAIAKVVSHYAPERIDPVDRSILRLATHELIAGETPVKVVINEAIELAKRFGTTDSGRFVNGVLDQLAKTRSSHPGSA